MAENLSAQTTRTTIRKFRIVAGGCLLSTIKNCLIVQNNTQQLAARLGKVGCQHNLLNSLQNPHIPFFSGKIRANRNARRQFPVANGHSYRYTNTSTPAGPLSQDTLSYGGFSFALMLSALALSAAGTWS